MGRGIIEAGLFRSERVELETRTSDPASPADGERWLRTDLSDTANDVLAELRWSDGSATNSIDVVATASTDSGVAEVLWVQTPNGTGVIPAVSPPADAEYPSQRLRYAGADHGLGVSSIPDSGIFRFTFDSDTISSGTVTGVWNDRTATISGETVIDGIGTTHDTGDAVEFDGSGEITLDTSLQSYTKLTVGGWFSSDSFSRESGGFRFGENNGLLLQLKSGNIQWYVYDNSSFTKIAAKTGSVGTNYHAVIGIDTGLGEARAWLDGSRIDTGSVSSSEKMAPTDAIGKENDGYMIDGRIDTHNGYSKLLSDSEVSNWYNTGSIN